MKFSDDLRKLEKYPFHMPGHKRSDKFGIVGSEIDITEIDGADNLHDPHGNILEIENALAEIYKSKKSFLMTNGSTGGILAAIFAVCNEGDKIIIARNCHKSVYNACMIRRLKVVYVEPRFDYVDGYYTNTLQDDVNAVLAENEDAKAIVITSPTYEGNTSRIKANIPIIIDAAHGAHFGIATFCEYPTGDIVISSLHKTLPALTQAAVANIFNEEYIEKFKRYIDIFETSSPSYIIMDSAAKCCDYIKNNKKDFEENIKNLWDFRDIELQCLRLKYSDDISKIVISCANANIDGTALADRLRKEYNIEPEMASKNYIILMTSVADSRDALEHLKTALCEIDSSLFKTANDLIDKPPIASGEHIIEIAEKSRETALNESLGKIANEFIYAYPPDIPIIVPGEIIDRKTLGYIKSLLKANVNIVSDSGLLPNKTLTKGA